MDTSGLGFPSDAEIATWVRTHPELWQQIQSHDVATIKESNRRRSQRHRGALRVCLAGLVMVVLLTGAAGLLRSRLSAEAAAG